MSFGIVLKKAADSLTEQTAFALASFWSGVCVADPRGNTASKILLGRFAGPSGMGPFGRAALIYASAAEAFSPLLDAVIEVAEGWPPLASETPDSFPKHLLESRNGPRLARVGRRSFSPQHSRLLLRLSRGDESQPSRRGGAVRERARPVRCVGACLVSLRSSVASADSLFRGAGRRRLCSIRQALAPIYGRTCRHQVTMCIWSAGSQQVSVPR